MVSAVSPVRKRVEGEEVVKEECGGGKHPSSPFLPPPSQLVCTLCSSSVPGFKEQCGTETRASPRRCAFEFCFCHLQVNLDLTSQSSSEKEAVGSRSGSGSVLPAFLRLVSTSRLSETVKSFSSLPPLSTPLLLKLGHHHHDPRP